MSPPPLPANLAAFTCGDASGGSAGNASLTGVRIAEQIGYDRLVLQFATRVPGYTVKRLAKPIFKGASGQTTTLIGAAGVLVQIHSASASGTYSGPTDFTHPDYHGLVETKLVEDFEGYLLWGVGLTRPSCLRVFTLADPARLVIDFKTA